MATWGSTVTGIAPTQLHQLRVSALRSHGRLPRGASVGLRLRTYLQGAFDDPAVLQVGCVAYAWAEAVWDGMPTIEFLGNSLAAAQERLAAFKSPWGQARDPIDVLVLTLGMTGWSATSASKWAPAQGKALDLLRLIPKGGAAIGGGGHA